MRYVEDQEGFVTRMRKQIKTKEINEKKRLAILRHEKEVSRQKEESEKQEKTALMFKRMKEDFDRVKLEMSKKKEAKSAKNCVRN